MKWRFLLPVVLLAGGALACNEVAAPEAGEPIVVPVEQEPLHRLVLERDGVQILDVFLAPGDTSLFHLHDAPFFFVSLEFAPTDAQSPGGPWAGPPPILDNSSKPGDVGTNIDYPAAPVTHRVTNIGTNAFRLIGVNHRGGPGSDAAAEEPALPGVQQVANRWFRSSRVELAGGAATDAFRLHHPPLFVLVGAGEVDVAGGGGAPRRLSGHGAWFFGDAGTEYRVTNAGTGAALVIVAEVR